VGIERIQRKQKWEEEGAVNSQISYLWDSQMDPKLLEKNAKAENPDKGSGIPGFPYTLTEKVFETSVGQRECGSGTGVVHEVIFRTTSSTGLPGQPFFEALIAVGSGGFDLVGITESVSPSLLLGPPGAIPNKVDD
jgi:hypothetical protein